MASAFSHAFVALTLGKASHHSSFTWPVLILGMICSVIPDLDVIGFYFGIHYGDLWGHRGMTHSLFFAGLLSAVLVALVYRQESSATRAGIGLYLFLCTASHGILDAMTDGGLGIAFFSPFDPTRYFFPFRPVAVSPIGISQFFSFDALRILASEIIWIWIPSLLVLLTVHGFTRLRAARLSTNQPHQN
jgi:inner membrane protein